LLLSAVLNDFGVLCKYTGRFADADRMYQRALKLVIGLDNAANKKDFIATIYHNLGGIAHARQQYAQALRYARRGVRLRKKIRPRDPVSVTADEAALAAILSELGRHSEAVRLYLRALRVFRSHLGQKHYEVGSVLTNLGAIYWRMARPVEAKRALRRGLLILENALGKNHPRVTIARNNLAVVSTE
jgi:tetratricopeptide (TPR) repeat protein